MNFNLRRLTVEERLDRMEQQIAKLQIAVFGKADRIGERLPGDLPCQPAPTHIAVEGVPVRREPVVMPQPMRLEPGPDPYRIDC